MWKVGDSEVIVAMVALIQGIDFVSVGVIIFHKGAFGMISYYQGAGRGGRSGLPCDIYMVWDQRDLGRLKASDADNDMDAVEEWGMFLKRPGCCMAAITSCFNKEVVSCVDIDGQQKCDHCEPGWGDRDILALMAMPQTSRLATVWSGSGSTLHIPNLNLDIKVQSSHTLNMDLNLRFRSNRFGPGPNHVRVPKSHIFTLYTQS